MTHNQAHTHSSSSLLWLWLTSRRCQNFLEAVRVHGNGQESTSLLIRHIKGRQKVLEPPALSEECRSVCDLRDFSPYWVVYSTELDVTDIVRGTERSRTPWYGIQHLHLVVELLGDSLVWNQDYRQVTCPSPHIKNEPLSWLARVSFFFCYGCRWWTAPCLWLVNTWRKINSWSPSWSWTRWPKCCWE